MVMGISRGKLVLTPVLGLTIVFAMLVGGQALAEPQPILGPDFKQESDSGIIGPMVTSGFGANQRLVNLNTGLPSGARGPLQNSSVPMALGAEVIVLQGERGAMGNIGAPGEQGPAGTPGIRGANGFNGGNGLPGGPGEAGSDGLDAFSIWKAQTGRTNASVTEFLSAIRGSDGSNGASGANGKDAEFPEESMTGLVQALIPNSGDQCGFGQYQVAVSNAWSATSLAPVVECRSLLPDAPTTQFQNYGLGFGNQISLRSITTQNVEPEIVPSCSVSQMFGALSMDANGALTVECVSSVYASNKLSDPKILDFEDSSFEKCGAQSFVGGLGFNEQNELVIGCVNLDFTADQSPILIDSQQCNENSSSASKVMVGLDVTITAEGKKLITIKCAPLVSLGDQDSSNNGNNSNSEPDGNNGSNQGNNGNNNDSAPGGNNGNGGDLGNNVDPDGSDDASGDDSAAQGEPEEETNEAPEDDTSEESQGNGNGNGKEVTVTVKMIEPNLSQQSFDSGLQGPSSQKGDKGDRGEPGLSAYQIWLNLGNSGSESDFIAALTITSPAAQGVAGPQGPSGLNGLSAFEVWRQADASRSSSTVSDFLLSLKGEKGDQGLSAFELWKAADGPRAISSVDDFLASLRGPQGPAGPAGLSAFEIWKNASPTRNNATEQDFLNSLNAIPAGWSERTACLDAYGTLALNKCSANDLKNKSVDLTILTKDN